MSVILTGMDIPETCSKCKLYCIGGYQYSTSYCGKTKTLVSGRKERNEDCPLKSVNGLIEKIQSEVASLRDYNTKLNQESDYYSTPEIQNVSGNIKGLLRAIAIIKEYCEVE